MGGGYRLESVIGGGSFGTVFLAHHLEQAGEELEAARWRDWPLADIESRLAAIAGVRDRTDFEQLADLIKRVDNILAKGEQAFATASAANAPEFVEDQPAAMRLLEKIDAD